MTTERVQILLEASQRRALANRAKQTGRSISELVREAVNVWMGSEKETQAARARALESAAQLRQRLSRKRGELSLPDAAQILSQVRDERLNDLNHR